MVRRLWLADKITLTEMETITLSQAFAAYRTLDAWEDAIHSKPGDR
jgi:hypothetical protein